MDTDALIERARARVTRTFELRDLEPYRELLGRRIEALEK